MIAFFARRWFLICLVACLAVGAGLAPHIAVLAKVTLLRSVTLATVMFLMALPLEAAAVAGTIRRPWAAVLGIAVNFGIAPLLAWPISLMLAEPTAAGLLVASATPCTLASAAVWTRRAEGNDAAALMVTVLTNASCFIVTPLWLSVLLAEPAKENSIDIVALMTKLGLLVVLPMVIAQLLRLYRPLGRWTTERKRVIGIIAQCGLLVMVTIGAVAVGMKLREIGIGSSIALDLALMFIAVAALHLILLAIGIAVARMFGLSRPDQIATGISGSQKTLMVGLDMSLTCGASILPMVTYHFTQLFLDTLVVDRWREGNEKETHS